MQFCKKILQTSAFLICFSINTNLLASDDADSARTPHGKSVKVFAKIHENWFAEHKKAESGLEKELSAYAQKGLKGSFQLEEFRKSFTASGLSEIFGVF